MAESDSDGCQGGGVVVKRAADVERTQVSAGTATSTQVLIGPQDGAPNFAMRRFSMGEGGGMPRHTNTVEHEQFVLRGRARIGIGGRVYEVGPQDVLLIPAGMPHYYEVLEAPFEFLCVVPNAEDRIEILEQDGRKRSRDATTS
jgi:quercetin dioxygenase-like cupin family protein